MQPGPAHGGSNLAWHRIEELLDAALDRPPAERATFLAAACDDGALRAEVGRLIEACEDAGTFLERPAAEFAVDLMATLPPVRPVADPAPSIRIGAFRIVREIGRGGMGTVYLAERESHFKQRVALKVVRHGLELDDALVRRFVDERQILASLDHPNVARLLDGGLTNDGLPWFAMELVEGEPIDRYCDARRLPVEIRLELLCTVCDAVDYAHRCGVVHRDLKPSNVLVRADGTVKLLDFGIAKLVAGGGETERTRTGTGLRLLTPEYASPEQLRGEPVSPASDVYSLGVLLFELLAGRRPRPTEPGAPRETGSAAGPASRRPSVAVARPRSTPGASATTTTRIARARATTPERLVGRLRGELDRITAKALARRVTERYPGAAALADDVRRHLEGHPNNAGFWTRVRVSRVAVLLVVAALAVPGAFLLKREWRTTPEAGAQPGTLAVGLIADYREERAFPVAPALADLLATNLARVPSLAVISTARLYELMAQLGAGTEPDGGAFSAAARRAGASVLIDGALYGSSHAGLRLDLRRIDVRTGAILGAYTISGDNLFALVDSGTARLAVEAGLVRPAGSIADVTTRSEVAYRFYEEGLRNYYRGDTGSARRMLETAVAEDSTFAMAVYYLARLEPRRQPRFALLERAVRLADRASDRERLIIRSAAAFAMADPNAVAFADTLAVRYPHEPEAHRFAGQAKLEAGDFAGALSSLRQAVTLDSLALAGAAVRCTACEARALLIGTYQLMDSLAVAEREAQHWTHLEPRSAMSWLALSDVLIALGQAEAGREAYDRAIRMEPARNGPPYYFAYHVMQWGDYESADRGLRETASSGAVDARLDALWYLTISLRRQGRLEEALRAAREYRALEADRDPETTSLYHALAEAQVLFEMRRWTESAALFDSIAHAGPRSTLNSLGAWARALAANPLAAAGDTVALAARIDTVRAAGALSLHGRDQRLHHHLQGLLLAARGDDGAAAVAFREAMLSPVGYTRTNLELARVLIRAGRPREAVDVLQPTILGSMEASALYATRTDLEEMLARAWDAAGVADSAVVHYRNVLHALERADPELRPRVDALRVRVTELAGRVP